MLDHAAMNGGRKRPSMDDVAAAAGVSKGAVSKVIRNAYGVSPAMRAKVEKVIDELGYRPRIAARSMRGASFTIGVEIPQLTNPFFTQIMQGAGEHLSDSEYQLIVAPGIGDKKGARILEALTDRQVDGIIAVSPEVTDEWLERIALDVPLVLIGRHDDSIHYDTVVNDDRLGVDLVMDHLFERGHRRIGHLTLRPEIDRPRARAPHAIRRQTYLDRMAGEGFVPEIRYCLADDPDTHRVATEMLRQSDRPTAIIAGNDSLAIAAQRALGDLGLTHRDVAIVGYDDIDLASHPFISLTTVDQDGTSVGRAAIDLLLERINGERTQARHHRIAPQLRVRRSSSEWETPPESAPPVT